MIQRSDTKLIEKLNDLSLFSNAQFDHVRFFFSSYDFPFVFGIFHVFCFLFLKWNLLHVTVLRMNENWRNFRTAFYSRFWLLKPCLRSKNFQRHLNIREDLPELQSKYSVCSHLNGEKSPISKWKIWVKFFLKLLKTRTWIS